MSNYKYILENKTKMYISPPVAIQDRHNQFTTTTENLWNNKYRASKKIAQFYHDAE